MSLLLLIHNVPHPNYQNILLLVDVVLNNVGLSIQFSVSFQIQFHEIT